LSKKYSQIIPVILVKFVLHEQFSVPTQFQETEIINKVTRKVKAEKASYCRRRYSGILWEGEIGTLASSFGMSLGSVVKIIIMKIYDSG
jgi:hypothetical protein